jgi:hypothetical protein
MFRKSVSLTLALVYAVTIPTLFAVHIHPLGIGSGAQVLTAAAVGSKLSAPGASESGMCQLCLRLTSISLPQLDSGLISIRPLSQSFRPFEISTISLLLFCSVDLRAPPVALLG